MRNNRKGVAQAIICALSGAVMGISLIVVATYMSSIDQTITLQAAENSYITAIHVSEEARLFMTKAMDFILQLAVEDVSAHGGLTSKAPVSGVKTTSGGVRYWKWCSDASLPATCDNSDCGPQTIPEAGLEEKLKENLLASATGYMDDYVDAFEENEDSHRVEVKPSGEQFTLEPTKIVYSSSIGTKVWTTPAGIGIDKSFRTWGVVESTDAVQASQNVRMKTALDMALAEANGLPARSAGHTYACGTPATKTFTRKCPEKVPKTCRIDKTCTDEAGNEYDCSEVYDCSSCADTYWKTMDSATVTDYDCLVTFKVPGSVMFYTLSPGEIKEKDHGFTFAANYRTWSGSCNTGIPPGTVECGDCEYV